MKIRDAIYESYNNIWYIIPTLEVILYPITLNALTMAIGEYLSKEMLTFENVYLTVT